MAKFRNYDKYEVFEDGRIWSYKTKKWLKPKTEKNGYQRIQLYDNEGNRKYYLLHRVIYESVSGSPIPNNLQINHLSEDKTSNFFANLELVTPKQNINWGSGISKRAKSNTNNPKTSKAVGAYKNDELVMTFQSVNEAQRQGFNKGGVWSCCNGKIKTHKGYTWKYI